MKQRKSANQAPAGFSLIELMVVLTIIGILMALASAAVFRVLESQKDANSQNTVAKTSDALQKHWTALITQARKENIPPAVIKPGGVAPQLGLAAMAQGDLSQPPAIPPRSSAELDRAQKRMRVLWINLRLQQEFPLTFSEATNPTPAGPQTLPLPIPVGTGGAPFLNPANLLGTSLAPKASYIRAIAAAGPGHNETSAMLYMLLNQSRGGYTFKVDEALASTEIKQYPDGVNEITDAWGSPVVFFRWPTAWPDLNILAPASPPAIFPRDYDSTDPEGLLGAAVTTPGGLVSWNNTVGGQAFQALCHAVPSGNYLTPVVMSYGRNGRPGVLWPNMAPDPADPGGSDDNIFSYRLRLGGRGD
jgi:prepilin-type N-terminal cleavage/methylation domain-containing protein